MRDKLNWNTILLTSGFGLLAFLGKELYSEVRQTHDAVVEMRSKMVSREEFVIEVTALRTRIVAIELDMQRLKSPKY